MNKKHFLLMCLCLLAGINASAYHGETTPNPNVPTSEVPYADEDLEAIRAELMDRVYLNMTICAELYNMLQAKATNDEVHDLYIQLDNLIMVCSESCYRIEMASTIEELNDLRPMVDHASMELELLEEDIEQYDPSSRITATTMEGVVMTFSVISEEDKTMRVGSGIWYRTSIPMYTTGTVTIPDKVGDYTVTAVGRSAFTDCYNITNVVIPESVTDIEGYAFDYCPFLTSLTIGSGVTSIQNYAFNRRCILRDVYCYAEEVPDTENKAFYSADIGSATLYVPTGSVEAYRTTEPWCNFGTIVPFDIIINDETKALDIANADNGKAVVVKHDFNGEWESLYLPFAIDYDAIRDNFDLAEIDGVVQNDENNDGVVDFTVLSIIGFKGQKTVPNKPYLIRAKNAGEQTLSFEDVTIYPTEEASFDCSSFSTKYEFTGSYNTLNATSLTECYVIEGSELVKSANTLAPCHWYMSATSRDGTPLSLPDKIRIMPVKDVITGVEASGQTTEVYGIYNLAGQHLNKSQKGLNIIDGKKLFVK